MIKPAVEQVWRTLTFLHWPRYDPAAIARTLPLSWISSFPETNWRTYVRGVNGEQGVARPVGQPIVHYSEQLAVKAGALQWI